MAAAPGVSVEMRYAPSLRRTNDSVDERRESRHYGDSEKNKNIEVDVWEKDKR